MAPKAEGPTPEEQEAEDRAWRRATTFDRDNEFYWRLYTDHVSKGKPTLDYVAMMGVAAICSTVFFVSMSEMLRDGWSDRRAIMAVISAFVWGHLIQQVSLATCAQVGRAYLSLLYRTGAPHPDDWDSKTLRSMWTGLIAGSAMVILAVIGVMGWEFAKAARMIGDPPKPAISQPAKPTPEPPLPTADPNISP
jgi:hypothetical protein